MRLIRRRKAETKTPVSTSQVLPTLEGGTQRPLRLTNILICFRSHFPCSPPTTLLTSGSEAREVKRYSPFTWFPGTIPHHTWKGPNSDRRTCPGKHGGPQGGRSVCSEFTNLPLGISHRTSDSSPVRQVVGVRMPVSENG